MLLCILGFVIAFFIILKVYIKLTTGIDWSYTCLVGKTVIVTGANVGIGKSAALNFAKRGARVILACRNKQLAENAKDDIIRKTDNPNVVVKTIDLNSFKSIKAFAEDIVNTEERLDILVNNAGASHLGSKPNEDGFLPGMQINYFGPFLLTMLLLDKLKNNPSKTRIVNVASNVAGFTSMNDSGELNNYPEGSPTLAEIKIYCRSKLCNILFTVALASRLRGTNVTVNALHPGVMKTELQRNMGISGTVLQIFLTIFWKTVDEGAQTTVYVAVSKDVEDKSGRLFEDCHERVLYKSVNNELAEDVWKKTLEMLQKAGYSVKA